MLTQGPLLLLLLADFLLRNRKVGKITTIAIANHIESDPIKRRKRLGQWR